MSAHATATAIEEAVEAFCRGRFTDAETYVVQKDALRKEVRRLIRRLRPQIGVPEMLSLGTGRRSYGGRSFEVVARIKPQVSTKAERSPGRVKSRSNQAGVHRIFTVS